LWSISIPPTRLESKFRPRCSSAPTRSLSDVESSTAAENSRLDLIDAQAGSPWSPFSRGAFAKIQTDETVCSLFYSGYKKTQLWGRWIAALQILARSNLCYFGPLRLSEHCSPRWHEPWLLNIWRSFRLGVVLCHDQCPLV
jgi:hypothetical protein